MASPPLTVCAPWVSDEELVDYLDGCVNPRVDALDPYVLADSLLPASDLLWRLSGMRWPGTCRSDPPRRPCAARGGTRNSPEWSPAAYDRSWGWCSCDDGDGCGCSGPSRVRLGLSPIVAVEEILLDGEVLVDGVDYRVDDYYWIVRLPSPSGSPRSWPCCQRVDLPTTEDQTWSVDVSYGAGPPPSAVGPTIDLAVEIAAARCGGDCQLPGNVERISRENVDMVIVRPDPNDLNLYPFTVRRWIAAVNPTGMRRPAKVWSPDSTVPSTRAGT